VTLYQRVVRRHKAPLTIRTLISAPTIRRFQRAAGGEPVSVGVRFGLAELASVFKTQLRAILRVSAGPRRTRCR
jgi:phosphoenolpyruvate-protein kinase (PTS system EI component)